MDVFFDSRSPEHAIRIYLDRGLYVNCDVDKWLSDGKMVYTSWVRAPSTTLIQHKDGTLEFNLIKD